ncbi:MAG: PEGA domain-containing protein, partial [Myxococcota bacterium]|nr:PEGA domain-containing protein [Myxococcota bacterium]
MFGRGLLSIAVVTALTGVAVAAPKRKVKIESEPAGATIYLNAKEDGPVCTTPCSFDAPVGDTPLIIELEDHKQLFENLSVPAKKAIATLKFKLEPALGTINVTGPAGARITVDDEDKGKAPARIEVGAGSHNVKLTLNGKQLASEFIDVPVNGEVDVAGTEKKVAAVEVRPPADGDGDGEDGGGAGA